MNVISKFSFSLFLSLQAAFLIVAAVVSGEPNLLWAGLVSAGGAPVMGFLESQS